MRWLIAGMLFWAWAAIADSPSPALTDLQRVIASQKTWLGTSRALAAEDLRGRIVLLDFWTLGCINCMDIIPDLKALEHEFGGNLTVIGVHSAKFTNEKDTENIRNAILRYGISHPVVNDADFTIWNAFDVRAWPTLVLLNPEGKIASMYAGEGNREALEGDIRALMEKYKGHITATPLPLAAEAAKQPPSALRFPGKVIVRDAEHLIVADSGHNRIVVTDLNGTVQEAIGSGAEGFKDGAFGEAQFYKPQGMAYKDGLLYVADLGNHALRLVDFGAHTVSTLAGTGAQGRFIDNSHANDARRTALSSPWDVAFYPDGNHLAIAMAGAQQLWSYDIARHTLSLLAGNGHEAIDDGHNPFSALAQPSGLFALGDTIYFTDAESSALRKLDKDGNVTTLIGKGLFDFGYKQGDSEEGRLQHCLGLTGDGKNLYIVDTYNHSVRRYAIKEARLYNYAGHDERGHADGPLASASFNEPGGIALLGDKLFVADTNNNLLRAIDMQTGRVSTLGQPAPAATIAAPAQPVIEAPFPVEHSAPAPLPPAAAPSPLPTHTAIRVEPDEVKLAFSVAPGTPIDVALELKSGWRINASAPSLLALEDGRNGGTPLVGFGRDMLASGHISLPKLERKKRYRLDGMLYYCPDTAEAPCMLKSFDIMLTPNGTDTKIALPVQ